MIPRSFNNELLKHAAPATGFLETLGKVLGKTVPSALDTIGGALRSAGLGDVAKAKMIGAGVGAVGGAIGGSKVGPEENKGRNTLLGAAAGAGLGAFGGSKLAPKVQSFGTAAAPALRRLGADITSGKLKNVGDISSYMAKNWSPVVKQTALSKATTTKALGQTTQSLGEISHPAGKPLGAVAELLRAGKDVENEGIVKGIGKTLTRNWNEAKTFERVEGGKNQLFERSRLGKIVNPALTSGIGMGALQAATVEGKNGEKPSVGKRLLSGGGTALAWGAAPKLTMGKMLAYDIPKTLIGMKKPKATDIPQQI